MYVYMCIYDFELHSIHTHTCTDTDTHTYTRTHSHIHIYVQDHAIYLCNLLLGLELDAYVCVGRLHDSAKGEKRHVWVMVREESGGVRMWETSTGDDVLLPGRWRPQVDALGRPIEKKGAKGAGEKEAAVGAEEEAEGKRKKRGFGFGRKQKVGDSSLGGEQPAAEAGQQDQLALAAPAAEGAMVKTDTEKEKAKEKEAAKAAPQRRRKQSGKDDVMVVSGTELTLPLPQPQPQPQP